MGKIIIKRADITKENVAVIVNAANTKLRGGGGVDGAIHRAAGPSVLEECGKTGNCPTGEAVITNAGNLNAEKIIHTPGPVWHGGKTGEPDLLRGCYKNSFILAKNNNLKSIAFPAISTGIYEYPIEEAAVIALEEGMKYIKDFEEIRYICFSIEVYEVYLRVYDEIIADRTR